MNHPIRTTVIFDSSTFDGYPLQFRYDLNLRITVFTGIIDVDDEFIDPSEVDTILLGEPGIDKATDAVKEWLTNHQKTFSCERCGTYVPDGQGKWDDNTRLCSPCYHGAR